MLSYRKKTKEPKNKFWKIMRFTLHTTFSCMTNREENTRKFINWDILLIEPQNYIHRRIHFTRSRSLPNQLTIPTERRQLSGRFLKIKNRIVEVFQFEKKEPYCILLHTRNPQTKEKKIFAIIEGNLYFPFFGTVSTLLHVIPSNLH